MKVSLGFVGFLLFSFGIALAQPFGLTNRTTNATLRMPVAPTPVTNINYRIPPDNPFIGATTFNGLPVNSNNVRTEFYAVGLRNPWRFSFDPVTDLLWLADVGQGAREEVDIIHKGGNYGWNFREGTIQRPGSGAPPAGFTHINPIQDYGRGTGTNQGASVTGGVVYRGSRIPELHGAYIFADYVSGNIWQMRYEVSGGVTNITPFSRIMGENEIVCFGTDPANGDVLMGDLNNAIVQRLLSNPYRVVNAFGALSFSGPMAIVTPPGETNRVFVVEQAGRIAVITNLANPTRSVFMNITNRVRAGGEQGLLGMAFHPGYATNRYFYVFYTSNTNGNQTGGGDNTRHDRLSRFQISATNTNLGDPDSELILINQRDEASNHNGGCVQFGPDGYLYVSLGDEGDANDSLQNSQNITKDFYAGMIRLDVDNRPGSVMPNPHPANQIITLATNLPPTLADTGAFTNLATFTPHAGIIPYDVNVPYWTDGAIKTRWFCIPDPSQRITFRATQPWTFPLGTVWIQHFDLEMTNGAPDSRRRIETRFLVRDTSTDPSVYGVTYRWDSPTNATLVPEAGAADVFEIVDGGSSRLQTWRYPSRAECVRCHTSQGGRSLGFNTPQLNGNFNYGGVVDNQIRALHNAGYFSASSSPSNIHALHAMAKLDDTSFGLHFRMRSYLMANCGHCHFLPRTPAIGNFNALIYRPFAAQGLLDGTLLNTMGNPSNRVVRAGLPDNSMAYLRMATTTTNRMPPLDSQLLDQQALSLFQQWIAELTNYQTFPAWQTNHFGGTNLPNALASADPDTDGAPNHLEYLTDTDPNGSADFWTIGIHRNAGAVSIVYTQAPNRGFEVQWSTNLVNTSSWRVLNIPANRPNFPGQSEVRTVPDGVEPGVNKFYRVRAFDQ